MRIPLSAPDITEAEIDAVAEVLRGSQLSLGLKLREFEAAVASFVGVDHAVAVSSGTAGLHLAMIALGIGEGDEVIVPSFTFIAAANVVRYVGATPVFVDIDAVTLNLSAEAVEQAITPRTRAVIAVHTFGRPAEIGELAAIARRHNLFLVEDACEALGAEVDGQAVGSFGDIAVFAFYPNKQITTGEGGMVVTADAGLAERMRSLRNQGRGPSDGWFQHSEVGFNYRLSEMACGMGIGQMARLPEILNRREQIARSYDLRLRDDPSLIVPAVDVPNARVSWFVYVVRLGAGYSAADRDAIVDALNEAGIGCGRYFAPIHRQAAYAAWRDVALPVTECESSRTIALPFFNRITEAQIDEVADCLKTVLSDGPTARGAVTS
jgi:perosamine synthetase